jgi:acyl dehydratase
MTAVTIDELVEGLELPMLERRATFQHWNRYAAVNDEFVDLHMDDAAGRDAGYPAAIGMGNLHWALLHNLLHDWAGPHGRVVRIACRFRRPVVRGATVRVRGVVRSVRRDGAGSVVDLELWVEDDGGELLVPAEATLAFACEGGT